MTRDQRVRRQALDIGDADDIVMIKLDHAGTQHADHYHDPSCDRVDTDPRELAAFDSDLYDIREHINFSNRTYVPKHRGWVKRGSKAPAKCVFTDDHGTLRCPRCQYLPDTISDLVNHHTTVHSDGQRAVAADGGGDT